MKMGTDWPVNRLMHSLRQISSHERASVHFKGPQAVKGKVHEGERLLPRSRYLTEIAMNPKMPGSWPVDILLAPDSGSLRYGARHIKGCLPDPRTESVCSFIHRRDNALCQR